MLIAHIADVHIRGRSRLEEYKAVCEELFVKLDNQNIDHIFVAGDIFHTKTQGISPEYIDFLHWWLKGLSSIAPLHLTLGNHDGNLVNVLRQDAISPIVNALDNERIKLYKNSGVYEFSPGYNWCIFSLFDKENWDKVKPIEGMVNIASYHGPVAGALSESNWSIDSTINVQFFKDFDYALLGDIHQTQFLDFREVELIVNEEDLCKFNDYEILEEIDA